MEKSLIETNHTSQKSLVAPPSFQDARPDPRRRAESEADACSQSKCERSIDGQIESENQRPVTSGEAETV